MTKSEMFKAAHKLAKTFLGNYRACFSLALIEVRNTPVVLSQPKEVSRVKIWEAYGKKRVYFTVSEKDFYYDVVAGEFVRQRKEKGENYLDLVTDSIMDYFATKFVA